MTNSKQAEETSVEIFSKALKEISFIRSDLSFAAWLTGISVYTVLEKLRSGDKEAEQEHNDHLNNIHGKFSYIKHSNDQVLERAISELPEKQRSVFVLRDIINYTDEEVSDLLRISRQETEKYLNDARDYLIQNLLMGNNHDELLVRVKKLLEKIEPETNLWPQIVTQIHSQKDIEQTNSIDETIVQNVGEGESDKTSKEKKKKKRTEKNKSKKSESDKNYSVNSRVNIFNRFKKIKTKTWISIILVLIVLAAAYIFFFAESSWTIKKLTGTPQLGYHTIESSISFSEDQELKTNLQSTAEITIKKIGRITVSSQTVLKRIPQKNGIFLEQGTIEVNTLGARKSFFIEVPNGKIKSLDLASDYLVEANPSGLITLEVKNQSLVKITSDKVEAVVPPDFKCNLVEKLGLGLPYNKEASNNYKDALTRFCFSDDKAVSLNKILSLSEKKDAFTLWNLIKRVSITNRIYVYEKLAELVPPKGDIDKGGIIGLDPQMMNAYLNEIKSQM